MKEQIKKWTKYSYNLLIMFKQKYSAWIGKINEKGLQDLK